MQSHSKFKKIEKRQMLINFLQLNESILHRRLLQTSMGQQEKTPKKDRKENVLATSELRATRFDKRSNKGGFKKEDKKEERREKTEDSDYK